MKTLLLKEARMLLPFWVAALLLAVASVLIAAPGWPLAGTTPLWFGVGIVLLSVAPFGMEFSYGTFQMLLAQPVPRRQIWLAKVFVALVAMASVLGLLAICWQFRAPRMPVVHGAFSEMVLTAAMMVMVILVGGLWTTLLLRQIAAALWFTPLIPGFLFVLVMGLTDGFAKDGNHLAGVAAMIAYSVVSLIWAAWLFARAQDTQWAGGVLSLPLQDFLHFRRPGQAAAKPRPPLAALVAKEFQLHHAALLIAGCVALLQVAWVVVIAWIGIPRSERAEVFLNVTLILLCFFWWCIPLLIGVAVVAEERRLGTLDAHLCLPVNRRLQFLVKLGVALFLSVICAAVPMWLMNQIAPALGVPRNETFTLGLLSLVAAAIGFLSLYASTLARNTLHALSIAVVVIIGCAALTQTWIYHKRIFGVLLWQGPIGQYICWPVLAVTLAALAYVNFRHLHEGRRTWMVNVAILLASVLLATGVTALSYHRAWELALPLEPDHGPAKIQGTGKSKVCGGTFGRFFVLLPDGRIWVSADYQVHRWHNVRPPHAREVESGFLPGTNLVDIVETGFVALRSDGSLWNLIMYEPRQLPRLALSRIGSDDDWAAVSGMASAHYLAIKQDGTLWGWGNNHQHALGSDLPAKVLEPTRLGNDSDWIGCHALLNETIGVKRDGSVWRYGPVQGTDNYWNSSRWIRLNLPGEPQALLPHFGLALYTDGGLHRFSTSDTNQPRRDLAQNKSITRGALALDMDFQGKHLWALARDGIIWQIPQGLDPAVRRYEFRPDLAVKWSRHSDWIALQADMEHLIALSADGKLCAWVSIDVPLGGQLLRPSRRPIANINILGDGPIPLPPPAD
jgi:hypothetical protein